MTKLLKSDLRKKIKSLRAEIDSVQKSHQIVRNIKSMSEYKNAKNVMIFYPMKHEVDLRELLSDNKNFFLPKTCNEEILICPYKNGDILKKSSFNVLEPITDPVEVQILDMIFVPALAVDKNFYRLGYGKGFYDRFLKSSSAIKITPIFNELILDKIPTQPHDERIDFIISEMLTLKNKSLIKTCE
ncbi:MAG: 5-formyltetrahydrofolate cyclo-ligase [Candidatus Melainabacteria bacterium]|nr:MAG: 5-formyltetrahydrofolate cyclo-ligase [Candidatus Melainabacteria bacterium]